MSRLSPPRERFTEFDSGRILLGHGEGVFEDAIDGLADTLGNARRRFPRVLLLNAPTEIRAVLSAFR